MEKVAVQVGELFSAAHLFEVVRSDNKEIAQSMKSVKELQHQWNLSGGRHT